MAEPTLYFASQISGLHQHTRQAYRGHKCSGWKLKCMEYIVSLVLLMSCLLAVTAARNTLSNQCIAARHQVTIYSSRWGTAGYTLTLLLSAAYDCKAFNQSRQMVWSNPIFLLHLSQPWTSATSVTQANSCDIQGCIWHLLDLDMLAFDYGHCGQMAVPTACLVCCCACFTHQSKRIPPPPCTACSA